MKSLLVLTGTTGFPLLENHMSDIAKQYRDLNLILQSPNPVEQARNLNYVSFLDLDEFDASNIGCVVGHCGAGTVFWTLEHGIPLIAIVDLTRPDGHQQDLGDWVESKNLGIVLVNRGPTIDEISLALRGEFAEYEVQAFSVAKIREVLSSI